MANLKSIKRAKDTATVNVGGRERLLKFDLNSFAELEKRFGTVEAAMELLSEGSMKSIRIILWAGLIHEEVTAFDEDGEPISYNISPYDVGGWVDPKDLGVISEALTKALNGDLPDPEDVPQLITIVDVPAETDGHTVATVVLTPEEKAEEIKNV